MFPTSRDPNFPTKDSSQASQVKSYLRCKYSAVKQISIDKAWNKQHRLGERRLKQSLSSPAYTQWLSSFNITG